MKKIFVSTLIIICFSCANETKVSNYTIELNELRLINDKLFKSNPEDIASIYQLGVKIKNTSLNLYVRYNQFFSDEENEFLLNCAATGSEASLKYKDAADYFLKVQRKFPNSKNAPIYLHNKQHSLWYYLR